MVSSGIYIHVSRYIVQLLFLAYFTFAAVYWLSYCRWGFVLSHCCWSFPMRLFPLPQWSRWTLVQSLSSVALLWPCAYCTELIESSTTVTFLSCWIGFSWSYWVSCFACLLFCELVRLAPNSLPVRFTISAVYWFDLFSRGLSFRSSGLGRFILRPPAKGESCGSLLCDLCWIPVLLLVSH